MCGLSTDESISLEALPLQSHSVLTLVDEDGIIRYKSPSVERVLGYGQDELVGERITERVHPDDSEWVSEMFQSLTDDQKREDESVEYRHETAEGTYLWVKSVGSAQPTDDGRYVINMRDVADRNAAEEYHAEAKQDLGQFSKVVSHDLRNPLNVASGHVELLYEDLGEQHADYRERLEKVLHAHDRMETLIQNLLTLARSGKDVDEVRWIDFDSLCQRCWRNVSTGNARVVIEFDGEIRADASRLQQLVENLIRNAVEHGGGEVTVTIGETDDGEGFYIADDGTGIPDSIREEVFQNGFSTISDGTGFGLAIVSGVADAHGWEVEIADSQDGGARFEITGVDRRQRNE